MLGSILMARLTEASLLAAVLTAAPLAWVGCADSSPLPATNTGSEVTVTLSKAGAVPYYCSVHAIAGMTGAIFVE